MVSNDKLKQLVEGMDEALTGIGNLVDLENENAFKIEVGRFMMYLSASDGTIEWEEASVISDICDLGITTPSRLGEYIRENNIYSTEFEQTVPVTLQMLKVIEEALPALDVDYGELSDAIVGIFRMAGEAVITADDEVDDNELSDFKIYMQMLEEFVDENFKGGSSVSGFKKDTGSVIAPSKGGVSAPRKG